MSQRTDVLVVGGGPAGATAAFQLAKCGAQVTLIDRATFPRDKTCGESLSPGALARLRAQCYVRMGDWQLALHEELRDEVIPDALRAYRRIQHLLIRHMRQDALLHIWLHQRPVALKLTGQSEQRKPHGPKHLVDHPILPTGNLAGIDIPRLIEQNRHQRPPRPPVTEHQIY